MDHATSILDRVKVMRVFEIAGLTEAISEVGQICENAQQMNEEYMLGRTQFESKTVADTESESEEEQVNELNSSSSSPKTAEERATLQPNIIGVLVIDTIATLVGPILRKNQIQGRMTTPSD